MEIYLCKRCSICKKYTYKRDIHDRQKINFFTFKFNYCEMNKDIVKKYNWFPESQTSGRTTYVRCSDRKKFGYNRFHTMYVREGLVIDHIDGNGLNNCLDNLRLVEHRKNSHNRADNRLYPNVYKEDNLYVVKFRVKGRLKVIYKSRDYEKAVVVAKSFKKQLTKSSTIV